MDVNITIIGAGVVGLAIARELSQHFDNIFVIEKNTTFGQETSSRNSEVVHAGIYYPKNSLKATLCVEGKQLLYNYCEQKQIPHKKIGKLIVATNPEEEAQLISLFQHAQQNGVNNLTILSSSEIRSLEPDITASAAIFSPSTGIVDSFSLMKQLETDAIQQGIQFLYRTKVTSIQKIENGYTVGIEDSEGTQTFSTSIVINAAGLFSDIISQMAGISDPSYTLHYWKGEYFSVGNGKAKHLKHLIYPVPNAHHTGLGIHATLDISHRLKLGPNALYLPEKTIDYKVDKSHAYNFYMAVKKFLPFIEPEDIEPDQAGIRPKLQKPGDAVRDFIIRNEADKGFPNFINLIGIESPGLTSCMAIAKKVSELIRP